MPKRSKSERSERYETFSLSSATPPTNTPPQPPCDISPSPHQPCHELAQQLQIQNDLLQKENDRLKLELEDARLAADVATAQTKKFCGILIGSLP